ncbi:MAG: hypothetical protein EZS28_002394 [Streblomastix strix]|uniref:Uncharacterized protein n=1 Tax=Streblomastix strix TaxID=222440 RepID=A0A5J4X626_9EUKA|nr:MAG: hypothetical protein EZS28_002394 [Streblomastix strix]
MPKVGLERSEYLIPANGVGETIDDASKPKENIIQTDNEITQITPEQLILTEQQIANGTSNKILIANGDTNDKDQLDYEPIENAHYSSIAYGKVYISLQITPTGPDTVHNSGYTLFSIVDNAIKTKFSGTPTNIPLNAVLFAQKVIGYPICWNGAIPIDCFINPNDNIIINITCQLDLPNTFCVQTIWEAAIKYSFEQKICR